MGTSGSADFWERVLRSKKKKKKKKKESKQRRGRAGHMWGQREGTAWESLLCCFGGTRQAAPGRPVEPCRAQLPLPSPAREATTFLGHPRPPGRHSGQQASSPAGTLATAGAPLQSLWQPVCPTSSSCVSPPPLPPFPPPGLFPRACWVGPASKDQALLQALPWQAPPTAETAAGMYHRRCT